MSATTNGITKEVWKGQHNHTCWKLSSLLLGVRLWCLTTLSTIFQLHRGGQLFSVVKEMGVPVENHRPAASH